MLWDSAEMFWEPLLRFIGYSLSIVCGNLFYQFSYELFHEHSKITLGSMRMSQIIWSLLRQKFYNFICAIFLIVAVIIALFAWPLFKDIVFKSDFWMVFFATFLSLIILSVTLFQDAYKYFICNSGLDCGSFMAYSFYHGYIKYVVASNQDVSSKDLKQRIADYEATHQVFFPIKKLLILQPKSMHIPPTLKTDLLQVAENLEEVKINRGGVSNRSYQLSVYKIEGPDWYVNVQGASPLLTYLEESKSGNGMYDKYKLDVADSFRKHLNRLISNDPACRGLVEVIYYDDYDEQGKLIDVGLVLKNYIEESLKEND